MVREHLDHDQSRSPVVMAEHSRTLAEIIGRTQYLLLDFDGPICDVFAGLPAAIVASQLRDLLTENGVALRSHIVDSDDPFEALRVAATLAPDLVPTVESALHELELRAIRDAKPTPYAREVIRACAQTGRAVAVVSNNAKQVIETYLSDRGLIRLVAAVVGRKPSDPRLLKPSPHLILEAMRILEADPQACTLVGDTAADIIGAGSAGIRSIGYANKPVKRETLPAAGADAVITSMEQLASTLVESRSRS